MSTKKIPTQTIETVYGKVQISDWRGEDDSAISRERTVASVMILDEFTVNGKTYKGVSMYLLRPNSVSGPALSEYGLWTLTYKAQEKVSAELLKHPELAEYLDVLDEDEKLRLKTEKAERTFIRESRTALQGLTHEDAASIILRLAENIKSGKTWIEISKNN